MSLLRNRSKSAGMVHKVGMTGDVLMLQDTVIQLQQQLLQTRLENKKVKDQLNCLITLVKQAWSGDRSAVQHVANIVGVAVPEICEEVKHNYIVLTAKPKSRAVNNWARLTVALLNHEYCQLENEREEKQLQYLRSREAFLEDQIEAGYMKTTNHGHFEFRQKTIVQPPPTPVQNGHSHHIVQQSPQPEQKHSVPQKKPTIRHLYRPANQKPGKDPENKFAWFDINQDQSQDCLLNKLNKQHVVNDHRDRQVISYFDPQRYDKDGLFDEETTVANNQMKRPMSCKMQRNSYSMRVRPKSAVLPKGQRPLRYETTRPLSGTQKANQARQENVQKRPQSSKQTVWRTFITNQQNEETEVQQNESQIFTQHQDNVSDSDEVNSETEAREQRKREAEALMVKIKLPESIQKFNEDLANMEKMQHDFKSRTLSLQKKLGIGEGGLIL